MIEIIQAEALDLTPEDFAEFDVLITDPPYSAHVHANTTSIGSNGRGARKRDLGFDALTPELRTQIQIAAGSVRRWSCIFSDFEGAPGWRGGCQAEYIRSVPWIRWSQPQLSGDRPPSGREEIVLFHATNARGKPQKKRWNGPGSLTHYARRAMRGADKHPTEKPIDLILDLVSHFTDPGDVVLDLCGGSGTTALACHWLGRSCLSVEIDPVWVKRAKKRLKHPAPRDIDRAAEWCVSVSEEASSVPAPRAVDGSDVKTWERAQRRLAGAFTVARAIS